MELEPAAVTLLYHKLQRVPERLRSLALHSRQITRPRLERGWVAGIGFRPNLEEDGIAPGYHQRVEGGAEVVLHFGAAHSGEAGIAHDMQPGAPEFALRR